MVKSHFKWTLVVTVSYVVYLESLLPIRRRAQSRHHPDVFSPKILLLPQLKDCLIPFNLHLTSICFSLSEQVGCLEYTEQLTSHPTRADVVQIIISITKEMCPGAVAASCKKFDIYPHLALAHVCVKPCISIFYIK